MRCDFLKIVALVETNPVVHQQALHIGKLDSTHTVIILPDDFDFNGSTIHPAPPVLQIMAPKLAEPTLADLASNFATAVQKWAAGGFNTVTKEDYGSRAAVCAVCEFWDGSARAGLGKCNAPGCGCTRLKRWLATERCPLGKWPV